MFDEIPSLEESVLSAEAPPLKDVPRRQAITSREVSRDDDERHGTASAFAPMWNALRTLSEVNRMADEEWEERGLLPPDPAEERKAARRVLRLSHLEERFGETNFYDSPLSARSAAKELIAHAQRLSNAPRASLPTFVELEQLRRRGALARAEPDRPRGSFDAPAMRRSEIDDFEIYVRALQSGEDERVRIAAAEVLGEWGGPEEIAMLNHVLHGHASMKVRSAAATALANIGGPEATNRLREVLASDAAPLEIRGAALAGLLDHVTGGWDNYQMTGVRVVLPAWLRADLESLRSRPDLTSDVTAILSMFD